MIFEKVSKNAIHYSEQIRSFMNHLDEVQVAGKIIEILPPIVSFEENSILNENNSDYMFKIDDGVGEMAVFVSSKLKESRNDFEVGNYATFKGYVNIIRKGKNEKAFEEHSVYAFESLDFIE